MIKEVLTDLYRVEIPLFDSPLKAVNSYVIVAPERSLIIDTGWNRQECMDAMEAGLKQLGVDLGKTDFFITHSHIDHIGLVSKLATSSSKVYLNRPDADRVRQGFRLEDFIGFARMNGFPEKDIQAILESRRGQSFGSEVYPEFTPVDEDDTINIGEYLFQCIATPGHTKGHMCLYEPAKRLLIAGDHILGDITPNITLWSDDRNPLKEYLESLDKVYKYPIDLALPGHRDILSNCKARILELKRHHRERAEEVISILEGKSKSAFQVASQMSWDILYESWDLFPSWQKWFATGEAIAHLKYLDDKGMVRKETHGWNRIFLKNHEQLL